MSTSPHGDEQVEKRLEERTNERVKERVKERINEQKDEFWILEMNSRDWFTSSKPWAGTLQARKHRKFAGSHTGVHTPLTTARYPERSLELTFRMERAQQATLGTRMQLISEETLPVDHRQQSATFGDQKIAHGCRVAHLAYHTCWVARTHAHSENGAEHGAAHSAWNCSSGAHRVAGKPFDWREIGTGCAVDGGRYGETVLELWIPWYGEVFLEYSFYVKRFAISLYDALSLHLFAVSVSS